MLVLGFASGLPLYMVFQKLSFWLRDLGIERSTIGFFYWVTFAYSFKFIWAPIVDRLPVPLLEARLGKRRSWMLIAMAGTAGGLFTIAGSDPGTGLLSVATGALLLAFSGATLDISIDAWRIESAPTEEQANMAAAYSLGYRGAYMFSGLGLALSEWSSWSVSFSVMAAAMLVCGVLVLLIREPQRREQKEASRPPLSERLYAMFFKPFFQLAQRLRSWTLPVLGLVAIYRLSDFTMGVMASPLYSDLGYSRAVVGGFQSGPGVIATITGLFLGGLVAYRLGVLRALILGAAITVVTNGAYAWLAATGGPQENWRLVFAIVGDNVAGGYVTTVFTAYLSSLADRNYVATQYAFLSSIYSLFAKFLSGFSGVLADTVGYVSFFVITASYALPAALLALLVMAFGSRAARGEEDGTSPPDAAQAAAGS